MKLVCPACGSVNSLDSLVGHDGARAALAELAALSGPFAGAVLRYLALFRPEKRQLSFDRVASLLAELNPMILEARISRNGRVYAAPREVWVGAIDSILASRDRLTLPLKSHGYLLEIIVGQIHKAEQAAETKRENARAGITPVGGVGPSTSSGRTESTVLADGEQGRTIEAPAPARASPETIAATLAAAKNIVGGTAK